MLKIVNESSSKGSFSFATMSTDIEQGINPLERDMNFTYVKKAYEVENSPWQFLASPFGPLSPLQMMLGKRSPSNYGIRP